MTRVTAMTTVTLVALAVLGGGALASVSADSVHIGVSIGVPSPVVVAPAPAIVVAPPTIIAPGAPVYFYGGSYYTFYNGAWFVGTRHAGPWGHVAGPPPWVRHGGGRHWREGHLHGPRR